jgi:outer membrane receptor protein involved in Fe transport
MNLHHRDHRGWLMASVVATAFVASASPASAQSATYEFNIPSQKLSSALTSYGTVANQQIIFSEDLVGTRISPPLQGRFTPEEAVRRLLTGSGLTAARTPKGVLLIQRAQSGLLKVSTETQAQGASLGAGASSDAGTGATSAPVAATADPSQTLSDVIVTAERREASAQRTPIAMSVLSPDTLQRNGVSALSDLARIAPSVNFSFVRSNAVITIRGVSSRDTTEIGDPAVATSIDGFFYQRTIGLNDSVFDLERVEVLRGPQGTLYGRNATGGAINFITAKPKPEFGASVRGGFGNYNSINTEGMVNVPVTNWLAIRASFATRSHDGYRNNAPGPNGDDAAAKAARIHLLFTPTDRLRVLLFVL